MATPVGEAGSKVQFAPHPLRMANSRQLSDPCRTATHCSDAGTTFFDPNDSIADIDIN